MLGQHCLVGRDDILAAFQQLQDDGPLVPVRPSGRPPLDLAIVQQQVQVVGHQARGQIDVARLRRREPPPVAARACGRHDARSDRRNPAAAEPRPIRRFPSPTRPILVFPWAGTATRASEIGANSVGGKKRQDRGLAGSSSLPPRAATNGMRRSEEVAGRPLQTDAATFTATAGRDRPRRHLILPTALPSRAKRDRLSLRSWRSQAQEAIILGRGPVDRQAAERRTSEPTGPERTSPAAKEEVSPACRRPLHRPSAGGVFIIDSLRHHD